MQNENNTRISEPQSLQPISLTALFNKQRYVRSSPSLDKAPFGGMLTKHSENVRMRSRAALLGSEEHATTVPKKLGLVGYSSPTSSVSTTSLGSAVTRFRHEFDELKCKMTIFGESLNICACMAADFKRRLKLMEKRLASLEKQHDPDRCRSYTAFIQKNKHLASRTKEDVRPPAHAWGPRTVPPRQAPSRPSQPTTNAARDSFMYWLNAVNFDEVLAFVDDVENSKGSPQGVLMAFVKHSSLKLQNCKSVEEMQEVAGKICRNYLHGTWKTVDPSQLEVKRISGGLSNFLYYVSLPDTGIRRQSLSPTDLTSASCYSLYTDEPRKVLIRIYGQVHGERAMDAIVTESVIFTLLSERRLGPKLHGVFSGGRIEEYIPARCLLTRELAEPALSMKIAEKMAAIHCMDVPLSKEPNWIWKTMCKWMKTVKEERLASSVGALSLEEQDIVKTLRTIDFEKEIDWLKKFIATVDSPVVFCHNDLQEGNILLIEDEIQCSDEDGVMYLPSMMEDAIINNRTHRLSQCEDANTSDSVCSRISDSGEPSIVFIDFEYCAYNYRGFDLANHFQEWGYDYTNSSPPFYFENLENLPSLEQKEIFIKEYLKHYMATKSEDKDHQVASIDDINHLLTEVEAFALVSHLFWTLWSIVNASKSQIPFGYWEYGLSRAETYLKLKQEVMKKEQLGLPQKRKICEVDI